MHIIIVTNPGYELPSTHRQRSLTHHMDSYTTQTCHSRLQFPSSIALITHTQLNALFTQLSSIIRSPKSYYTHYIRPTQIAEYCIAYITLLAIATLRSPLSSHSLSLPVFSCFDSLPQSLDCYFMGKVNLNLINTLR